MTKGLLFWILFVLAILFGGFTGCHAYHGSVDFSWGFPTLEMILLGLLGWQVFGSAVK